MLRTEKEPMISAWTDIEDAQADDAQNPGNHIAEQPS
jgi:hypothetical protein